MHPMLLHEQSRLLYHLFNQIILHLQRCLTGSVNLWRRYFVHLSQLLDLVVNVQNKIVNTLPWLGRHFHKTAAHFDVTRTHFCSLKLHDIFFIIWIEVEIVHECDGAYRFYIVQIRVIKCVLTINILILINLALTWAKLRLCLQTCCLSRKQQNYG